MKKVKHISYPKIVQFRNVATTVARMANFVGLDENGNAIYDESLKKPVIKFKGSVKIHGTNAGVCYNDTDGIYSQSRNNAFTLDKSDSHMGFTFFVKNNENLFKKLFDEISRDNDIDTSIYTISVFGEWAGNGIQKGVSVSELDKKFYLFGIKVSNPNDIEFKSVWLPIEKYRFHDSDNIWNINDFKTYEMDVDFNNPKLSVNDFVDLVNEVEGECPVGKHFGVSGIGEGIVWVADYKNTRLIFKTKGEKHSKSKIKTIKPVDNEKLQKIQSIAHKVTPSWRLEQFFNEITNHGKDIQRKHIGNYIRLVIKDIYDEDSDIIEDAGLEPKDINKTISTICKDYFFMMENENF